MELLSYYNHAYNIIIAIYYFNNNIGFYIICYISIVLILYIIANMLILILLTLIYCKSATIKIHALTVEVYYICIIFTAILYTS